MDKVKKIIISVIAIILVAALAVSSVWFNLSRLPENNPDVSSTGAADGQAEDVSAEDIEDDVADYEYTLSGQNAKITAYNGEGGFIFVPDTLGDNNEYTVTGISASAFAGNTTITDVVIPEGVAEIEAGAFKDCTALETVEIDGACTIDDTVFEGCAAVNNIDIRGNIGTVGSGTFKDCRALVMLYVEGGCVIGENAFAGFEKLENVSLETGSSVGDGAFADCTALEYLYINEVPEIGAGAFKNCTALDITVLDGIKTIGKEAFAGCTAFTEPDIPDGVTKVDERAYADCTEMTTAYIPASVTDIAASAFDGCTALKSIDVDSENKTYASINDALYTIDGETLVILPAARELDE